MFRIEVFVLRVASRFFPILFHYYFGVVLLCSSQNELLDARVHFQRRHHHHRQHYYQISNHNMVCASNSSCFGAILIVHCVCIVHRMCVLYERYVYIFVC